MSFRWIPARSFAALLDRTLNAGSPSWLELPSSRIAWPAVLATYLAVLALLGWWIAANFDSLLLSVENRAGAASFTYLD